MATTLSIVRRGKLCKENDLVLNRLKAHLGVFAHAERGGIVSPDYTVFRPIRDVEVKYFELLFKTPSYIAEFRRSTKGIVEGFWRLYTDDFYNIIVPCPPPAEQVHLLAFLNAADRGIGGLIRAKRRLIDLLNERKQAIIHQAVTRGLDPDMPLKPSGVPWLGDVPEHWEVKPLKHWVQMNRAVLPESTDPEAEITYLDIGVIGTGILTGQPERLRFGNAPSRARRIVQSGDTILSTVRTYLKAVYFIGDDLPNLIASTGFAVLSPNESVEPEYLSYLVQDSTFVNRVTAYSVGVAYPAITETQIGAFEIAIPPTRGEQTAILQRVRADTATIDASIDRTRREIDLLREYRTRLIADVVTGKLDVRDVPLPDDGDTDAPEDPGLFADDTDDPTDEDEGVTDADE